jgi:predicted phage-related endonuclease
MDEIRVVEGCLAPALADQIKELKIKAKELSDLEKKVKEELKNQMMENDVKKISCENGLTITLIPPTTEERIDGKTLKEELPDIYNSYCKINPKSAYVKVEVK